MSLAAILDAIEATGEEAIAHLSAETESRAQHIRADAERQASIRRDEARRAALQPSAGERARRLHHAKLEALRTIGEVRDRLMTAALAETQRRLAGLRAAPEYPLILRRLTQEAIDALGEEGSHGNRPVLEVDPRDEVLLRRILRDFNLDVPVTPSLDCWGGVAARSADGRIVATNTLESRLERALPFLRRNLAAFFEKETSELAPAPSIR